MRKGNFSFVAIICIAFFLRFFSIQSIPPGLYLDEAGIGINAYSILNTGKDEYGKNFPLYFKSFGEYKLPGYIYATSLSMAVFGKTEFAIRFFSAFGGSLSVVVFYFFLKRLLALDKTIPREYIHLPLLSSFLLAISSWHIHFSRGGFEANLALFFYLLACFLALLFFEKKKLYIIILSTLFFASSMYTYNAYRMLAPLTVITIFFFFTIVLKNVSKNLLIALSIFLIFSSPILFTSFTKSGSERLVTTLSFNEYKTTNNLDKAIIYPMVYIHNYFSFFSLDFIVNKADGNNRHQIPGMGLIYKWELPFLLLGILSLIRFKKSLMRKIILFWLIATPILPALTSPSPHSLRVLLFVIPFTILITLGILWAWAYVKRYRPIALTAILLFAAYEITIYFHLYYHHYSNVNALDWGGGTRETVVKAKEYANKYSKIVIDNYLDTPPVYFTFYAPELQVKYVDPGMEKYEKLKDKKILFIRPYYGEGDKKGLIDQIYLPGPSKQIYAQFWEL